MEEKKDIVNILQVFDLVKASCVAMIKAKEDGNINWKDLLSAETRDLIPKVKDALDGITEIKGELLDLDPAEVAVLYAGILDLYKLVLQAFLNK